MQNYKIKVNNEAESKEAQELFEQIGYRFSCMHLSDECNSLQVFDDNSGSLFKDHYSCSHKELTLPQLRDLVAKSKPKTEQGLISGADALRALADGKEVEHKANSHMPWGDASLIAAKLFSNTSYQFRIKPSSIKLNGVEVPAPFEPSEFEEFYVLSSIQPNGYIRTHLKSHAFFGAWHTEEEIKQVVEALRGALNNG